MTAFAKLTYLDLKMFWRDPAASFFTLGLPLLLLLFFVGGNEPRQSLAGLGVADFMVSGYIGLILATSGFMALSQKLALDRENGILRRMRTTPISPLKIMAAYVTAQLLITSLSAAVLLASGRFAHGLRVPANPGAFIGIFLLSAVSIYSIGFFMASVLPTAKATQRATMLIYFPMIFFTGATAPLQALPDSVQPMSQVLPLTYAISAMQGAWAGAPLSESFPAIGILAGVFVVATAVSVKMFRWE
jgi:ABC-2 type transport system permease protein